jgi:hypothetical protein
MGGNCWNPHQSNGYFTRNCKLLKFEVTVGEAKYERVHKISNEVVSNMLALEDQVLACKQHGNACHTCKKTWFFKLFKLINWFYFMNEMSILVKV